MFLESQIKPNTFSATVQLHQPQQLALKTCRPQIQHDQLNLRRTSYKVLYGHY